MKIHSGAGVRHQFDLMQVIAITADINYSYVYFVSGECLLRSRTLKWFLDRWPTLVRIHKNALININYVHHYNFKTGKRPYGYVMMKNNLRLDVSRRNLKQVSQLLEQSQEGRVGWSSFGGQSLASSEGYG